MTSPIQPFTEGGRVVGARLCGFHTGKAELLRAHKDWIARYFVPKMKEHPNAWVDLVGSASPVGDAARNVELSKKRIATVETYMRTLHPQLRFNLRIPQGASDAASFRIAPDNDDAYWRAVLVRWYGVPLQKIQTPSYPPEPESPGIPLAVKKAPPGCWCIVGVDGFGLPIKAPASGGTVAVTLLNDRGELYTIGGIGGGIGVGASIGPDFAARMVGWLLNLIKEVGLKAGDLANVSQQIKALNLTGSVPFGVGRPPTRWCRYSQKASCCCAAGVPGPQRGERGAVWAKGG